MHYSLSRGRQKPKTATASTGRTQRRTLARASVRQTRVALEGFLHPAADRRFLLADMRHKSQPSSSSACCSSITCFSSAPARLACARSRQTFSTSGGTNRGWIDPLRATARARKQFRILLFNFVDLVGMDGLDLSQDGRRRAINTLANHRGPIGQLAGNRRRIKSGFESLQLFPERLFDVGFGFHGSTFFWRRPRGARTGATPAPIPVSNECLSTWSLQRAIRLTLSLRGRSTTITI